MLSPDAIRRLREVKQHILAEPDRLMMRAWSFRTYGGVMYDSLKGYGLVGDAPVKLKPPCGTAACIAGWVCLLDSLFEPTFGRGSSPDGWKAAKLLGSDEDTMWQLFMVSNWPQRLQDKFATINLRQRASAAGEAIELFIAGDGKFKE